MARTGTKLFALVRAARPLAHANIAPPILLGQALAYATTGRFSWAGFVVAHVFGVLDHLVVVLANDYADRDADRSNASPTPFSGGSRVLQRGDLEPNTVRWLVILVAFALLSFSYIASSDVPALPWLAIAALALMFAYSYLPLRLSYRGGGELLQGLGVGVVLPLVGLSAQGAPLDIHVFVSLAPTFVLGVAGNVLTSIPDEHADRDSNKWSPAARWGGSRARLASIALLVLGVALGTALLAISVSWAVLVLTLALAPQFASLALRASTTRASTIAFVVLGGACESLAMLGWSIALVCG